MKAFGRPIESDIQSFLIFQNSLVVLRLALKNAQSLGRPQQWQDALTNRPSVICYPTGEIEFIEETQEETFLPAKRAAQSSQQKIPYIEMTWEERLEFNKMEPIGMDDVLDVTRLLRDHNGGFLELLPGEGPIIEENI